MSTGKLLIMLCLKTCVPEFCVFCTVPKIDRPDGQTGAVKGTDLEVGDKVSGRNGGMTEDLRQIPLLLTGPVQPIDTDLISFTSSLRRTRFNVHPSFQAPSQPPEQSQT